MSLRLTTNTKPDVVPCPTVPKDLLEYLQRLFPDRAPARGESLRDIRHKVGQVSVVRHLAEQFKTQNETILSSPVKPTRVSRKQT